MHLELNALDSKIKNFKYLISVLNSETIRVSLITNLAAITYFSNIGHVP